MTKDLAIIGAGASGLFLASHLKNKNYVVIDSNSKIGAKIAISGGGKCNITNKFVSTQNYLGDSKFIAPILEGFSQKKLLAWLRERGLEPVMKKEHQYFCPNSAKEILDIFSKTIPPKNLLLNTKVEKVSKEDDTFIIQTNRQTIRAKKLVVASGGLSYTSIGASDIGYQIAQNFGHRIIKPSPALVGFTVQKEQFFFKELSGLSTEVTISVEGKSFSGSLLFAHKGISGPVVLNASLYWQKGAVTIDFLNGFDITPHRNSNKLISSLLPLPKRLTKAFLVQFDLVDKPIKGLSKDELAVLGRLSSYSFAPAGNFGYTKAEVTKGGVSTDEIDAQTMQSRLVDNLYFIGEVLDVTGELGGYNFQWAFSSAYECAKDINAN
ncbi:MAG: aminoacetone oxidase family FAD-binding enzyme [Campylobacterales bacterium]|nr:aminoacetone oxidase family FAD-binding enzyme [Campylobacterales bacterium]